METARCETSHSTDRSTANQARKFKNWIRTKHGPANNHSRSAMKRNEESNSIKKRRNHRLNFSASCDSQPSRLQANPQEELAESISTSDRWFCVARRAFEFEVVISSVCKKMQ